MSEFACLKEGVVQPGDIIEQNTLPADLCEMNCQANDKCHMYLTSRSGTNDLKRNCVNYDTNNIQNHETITHDTLSMVPTWENLCVKGDLDKSPSIISTEIVRSHDHYDSRKAEKEEKKSNFTVRNIVALLFFIFMILLVIALIVFFVWTSFA